LARTLTLPAACPARRSGTCRLDSLTTYIYCPDELATPEDIRAKFVALAPPSLAAGASIVPGAPVLVSSVLTGQYCRAVDVGKRVQILCDVADASQASEFVYTGAGLPGRLLDGRR
jgi:hypothetical protein